MNSIETSVHIFKSFAIIGLQDRVRTQKILALLDKVRSGMIPAHSVAGVW